MTPHSTYHRGLCDCGQPCRNHYYWEAHRDTERRIELIEADVRVFGGPQFTLEDLERLAFPADIPNVSDAA